MSMLELAYTVTREATHSLEVLGTQLFRRIPFILRLDYYTPDSVLRPDATGKLHLAYRLWRTFLNLQCN